MEFVRDQIWEFVGVVVAVVAILITVIIFLIERRKRAFMCQVFSAGSLLSVDDAIREDVQILLEGKPIHDLHSFIVTFVNTGNVPILPKDFVETVRVNFGEDAEVLGAEVLATDPNSVSARVWPVRSDLILAPTLLNGGDTVIAMVLVSGYGGDTKVNGRIVGIREIKKKGALALKTSTKVSLSAGVLVALIGIAGVLITNYSLIDTAMQLIILKSSSFSWLMMLAACLVLFPAFTDRAYGTILFSGSIRIVRRVILRDLFPALNRVHIEDEDYTAK